MGSCVTKSHAPVATVPTIDRAKTPRYTLFMFGISGEHLLILGIVLLIFGPKRLPELGNTLGKAIRNFKDSLSGVEEAKFRRLDEAAAKANPSTATAASTPATDSTSEHKT